MPPRGIDANFDLAPHAAALVGEGLSFVGRYYCATNDGGKRLTQPEAIALSEAGLDIVVVWETGYPTSAAYFSRDRGLADGAAAYAYARDVIGQPQNTTIYFAVDYDASSADVAGPIAQYFTGVLDAFIQHAGGTTIWDSRYQVGAYGSGNTLNYLESAQFITATWLAQSTGWGGYASCPSPNIRQGPQVIIAGVTGDGDETDGHPAGWQIS